MSQNNSNHHQKRLYAVGGFVFGASAVAAVIASYNLLRRSGEDTYSTLRGNMGVPNSKSGGDAVFVENHLDIQRTANVMSVPSTSSGVYELIAPNGTAGTNVFSGDRNSNDVVELISAIEAATKQSEVSSAQSSSFSNQTIPSTSDEVSVYPTYSPTSQGELPTFSPTQFNDDVLNTIPAKRSKENGFRLKMYWEDGYYWQERTDERWWCMSCQEDGKCESGSKMELRNCKKKSDLDATFIATSHGTLGHQFRITNTNLCLTKMGRGRAIKLKKCWNPRRKHFPLQLFKGFKQDEKFDLRPSGYLDRCLSNHHHPKAKEIVYAETCVKAHRPDTGYWVTY